LDSPDTKPVAGQAPAIALPVAQPGRFGPTRLNLGKFVRTGDKHALYRGISDYVGRGYGGRHTAAKRFEGTARTAGALHSALQTLSYGQNWTGERSLDRAQLSGRPAREVLDAVIDAVRPSNGTQDSEASREAVAESLSELLERFPDADLLALTPEQIDIVIECYTAEDIYRRVLLDVGKAIQSAAPTLSLAMSRIEEIREYIYSVVNAQFTKLRSDGKTVTSGGVSAIVRNAIANTMTIFELTRT
jgi:hypothetical protein